jgi:hypothetical protein
MYGSSLFPIDSHLSALPAPISACPWLFALLCMLVVLPCFYYICGNCCLWMFAACICRLFASWSCELLAFGC